MKFVLASYGTRGDVEPCVVVGRELKRRGHEVYLAVPPDLVGFVESGGLAAVPYGLDTREPLEASRNFFATLFRSFWKVREIVGLWREVWEPVRQCWGQMDTTLFSLAEDADLLLTCQSYEEVAANVAEFYDIPLATLHSFPLRANGRIFPSIPSPLTRFAMVLNEWMYWLLTRNIDNGQRRGLGLKKASEPAPRRIAKRQSLEIQTYDDVYFAGLAADWKDANDRRPRIGTLTMALDTEADEEVAAWVAAGTPPIYFGFGSIPVDSPKGMVAMISDACAQLGERALICAGWSDFGDVPLEHHVKIVGAINYATIFPTCRAVVHHGGAATTSIGLRAGVPTLILWVMPEPSYWGAQVKRLGVGTARRFSTTDQASLLADLRQILAPEFAERARALATRMTEPAVSGARAADLLEKHASIGLVRSDGGG